MQDHHTAFFHDILADPDADGPRLVYADLLEEQGDPRAEFIRVQMELARSPLGPEAPRRRELEAREAELLAEHRTAWLAPFRPWAKHCVFSRGFVGKMTIPGPAFLAHAAAIFQSTPLRHLQLLDAKPVLRPIAALPQLGRLATLNFWNNNLEPADAQVLARSPHLARLEHLNLYENRLGTEGVQALTRTWDLRGLRTLNLGGNWLDNAAARVLAGAATLTHLADLRLFRNRIDSAGVQALAESPLLAWLKVLDLGCNLVGDSGARALAESRTLRNLESLDLTFNALGARARGALRERFGDRVRL
jgi:uncharacterized protein (TIGR02996 family)